MVRSIVVLAEVASILLVVAVARLAEAQYNETLFREIVTNDRTNDDAQELTTEELLVRSGFKYEVYYVIAKDGYISQVVRIVNDKVNRTQLKQPPVLLYHGAYFDTSSFLFASSIQHHPEPYPRSPADGPYTSSNRSLGPALVNDGYDVYIMGTRGSNKANQAYTSDPQGLKRRLREENSELSFKPDESMYEFVKTNDYWQYCADDIADYELSEQLDLIGRVSGSQEFSLLAYSLGTSNSLAFLSSQPEYARRIRVYILMAPTIAPSHFTAFPKVYAELVVPLLPSRGDGFTPTYTLDKLLKQLVLTTSASSMTLRYTLVSQLLRGLYGPSRNFETNLELNVLAHSFRQVAFKAVKQYGQASVSRRFARYDYGPLANLQKYGSVLPPLYNITRLAVQNYAMITGSVDALASPETAERLKRTILEPALYKHFVAPEHNHLDLLAGVQTAKYITEPVREILEHFRDR